MRTPLYFLTLSGSLLATATHAQSGISSSTRSDSLTSTASYNKKLVLPLRTWGKANRRLPTDQALVYGSCMQRLGNMKSGRDFAQHVRLANLSTGKVVRLEVKPSAQLRAQNVFCAALPPGRYALYQYEYAEGHGAYSMGGSIGGPTGRGSAGAPGNKKTYEEDLYKALGAGLPLRARRYEFTVAAGQLYYVGTWDLSKEDHPAFRDEKAQLDTEMRGSYKHFDLEKAVVAVPL
jgi:hypothetical protein